MRRKLLDDVLAESGEEFRVSVAPLLEQHEQDGVQRTVLGRQRVVDEVHDVLEALRGDPDHDVLEALRGAMSWRRCEAIQATMSWRR